MIKILIIAGKTASGKTSIVNDLVSKYGMKQIVTYTTRPIRKGEADGITYHYINKEDFQTKIKENFFVEWKSYETQEGIWYYGTAKTDLDSANNDTVIILTPQGIRDISLLYPNNFVVYLYINHSTMKNRLNKRNTNKEENLRRLKADDEDFKNFEMEANKIIYNNDNVQKADVVEKILKEYKERKEK